MPATPTGGAGVAPSTLAVSSTTAAGATSTGITPFKGAAVNMRGSGALVMMVAGGVAALML